MTPKRDVKKDKKVTVLLYPTRRITRPDPVYEPANVIPSIYYEEELTKAFDLSPTHPFGEPTV